MSLSAISTAKTRSLSPGSPTPSDGALSWEEVNFAEYEEVSDDDLRDAVVVGGRGRTALSAADVCIKTSSLSTQESGSPMTTSSRDGSGSLTPPTPKVQVQYFDLTKPVLAPLPNAAARILQAWWRTTRCPTSIHLPDADEEEEEVIEVPETRLQEVSLSTPAICNSQGVALRVGSANQWDLWERQMEEDMPLVWDTLDRRWLIYTMLLWLVLTMFSSNPFHFQVPMALANSSASAQASKTPAVQSKVVVMNASNKLLLPKHQIPNLASSFAYPFYPFYPFYPKGNSSIKAPPAALVIKVKTHFVASTIAEADAESAWLSEARVRFTLSAKAMAKVWVRKLREPSLWPWSFLSPPVAGLLPPPKPAKQGTDFKVWWWLLGEKATGVIAEPSIKLACSYCSLTLPGNVPLLTWTPKQKTLPRLRLLQPQHQPQLRLVPNLLPIVRPSTSMTTRMFFNQWQPEVPAIPRALPMAPLQLRLQVDPRALDIFWNVTSKEKKEHKERPAHTKRMQKGLQKGLRKAKKKAETILEKSRMQALHHLEKARKAFEKKVAFACLTEGSGC